MTMAKVVYNACHGGFCLSQSAAEKLAAMGVSEASVWLNKPKRARCPFVPHDMDRHDPRLVRVVEELGSAANGECADLRIHDLDGATHYTIRYYDGKERVEETGGEGISVGGGDDVEAIVWFLRERAGTQCLPRAVSGALFEAADAIERGEYKAKEKG
jgi:hypothetical protein